MKMKWFIPIIGLLFLFDLSKWEYEGDWTLFKGLVSMFIMFENVITIIFLALYFKILPL